MKIGVISTSRADFGIYLPLLKKLEAAPDFSLTVVALGMHLSKRHGFSLNQIRSWGFNVIEGDESISEKEDTLKSVSLAIGKTSLAMSKVLSQQEFDLIFCLGDRYEMLGAVASIIPFNIPIAHIHGGERSEGAIDEKIRHAITKLSDYHFVTCEEHWLRVVQMGEFPDRVFNVGACGIDNLKELDIHESKSLAGLTGFDFSKEKVLLGTYHPLTKNGSKNQFYIDEFIKALEISNYNVLMTGVNADPLGDLLSKKLNEYSQKNSKKVKIVLNLGQQGYISAMKRCHFIVGNSSSGIIEAATFDKPVVNIGERQKGRAHSQNVIHTAEDHKSILEGFSRAEGLIGKKFINIYEKDSTSSLIIAKLRGLNPTKSFDFFDIKFKI